MHVRRGRGGKESAAFLDSYTVIIGAFFEGRSMLIKRPGDIPPSEITPPGFPRRREFMKFAAADSILGATGLLASAAGAQTAKTLGFRRRERRQEPTSTSQKPTDYKHVTSYNNYYEFGTEKEEPARYAKALKVRPWSVVVEAKSRNRGRSRSRTC